MEGLRSIILRIVIVMAAAACYGFYSGNNSQDKSATIEMNESASDASASLVFELDSYNDEQASAVLNVPYNAEISEVCFDTRDISIDGTFPFSLWLPPKA